MQQKLIFTLLMSVPAWLASCFNANKVAVSNSALTNDTTKMEQFYSLQATTIDGETMTMEKFRGKKIIILNVASKCGYTPQYADWQSFYDAHKEEAVVLGFPCNQFMFQEPGSAAEIESFCQKNYGVSFPMFDKVDVKGSDASPVYKWLSDPAKNGWNSEVPSWNFSKYLVNEKGQLVAYFAPGIKPSSPEFLAAWNKK
jgi:glutathione peroxidase